MGLENLRVLQEVRKRKIEEDDLQSVPLVPVPKQVLAATAAYVKKKTIASKMALTSASSEI